MNSFLSGKNFQPWRIFRVILRHRFLLLDTETHDFLLDITGLIAALQNRRDRIEASLEENAYRHDWINFETEQKITNQLNKNGYGQHLTKILNNLNTSPQLVCLSCKKTVR